MKQHSDRLRILTISVVLTAMFVTSNVLAADMMVWRWQESNAIGLTSPKSFNWSDRWDFIVPIDKRGRILIYSRAKRVMKLLQFDEYGSYQTIQTRTNVGHNGHEHVVAGNFDGANIAIYNRATKTIEYWSVKDSGIHRRSSYGPYLHADSMVAGNWDTRDSIDELLLYDKLKGKLTLVAPKRIALYLLPTRHYSVALRTGDFGMSFEKMTTHDWDANGRPAVWFHNSDTGAGLSVEIDNIPGVVSDYRTVLPASPGNAHTLVSVIPRSSSDHRDQLMVYRRDCDFRNGNCKGRVSLVARQPNGSQDIRYLQWRSTWTHIVPFQVSPHGTARLLYYSARSQSKVLFVRLHKPNQSNFVKYTNAFTEEILTQLNLSFAPAGIGFEYDGILRNFHRSDLWDWCSKATCDAGDNACEAANTACTSLRDATKVQLTTYASYLSRSACVACVESDAYCKNNKYDSICNNAFLGRCNAACTNSAKDQVVAFIHSHGQGFSSLFRDYVMLPDMDTNKSKRVYTDGSVRNRFGELQSNSNFKELNYKIVIHEFGHFFGLCHSHFDAAKKTSTDVRVVDGEATANDDDWFISHDTAPKPSNGRLSGCCPAGQVPCPTNCWMDPVAINYCSDLPITVKNKNGGFITVNSDRTQPMGYGGDCNGVYRFSPAQILHLSSVRQRSYGATMPNKGRAHLFN